ncbi:MAG TPA: tetratricopeptide repeat protein [Opitutaceae bacterium]|nr:tetratricopeptide repeat protein [Opitutaceae bacterium]
MADVTPPAAIAEAIAHHQAGRLREAEAIYRHVLAQDPDCVPALHNLGTIALRAGDTAAAAEWIGRAARLAPMEPAIQSKFGHVLQLLGRLDEAIAVFERARALRPDHPVVHCNLGSAFWARGQTDEALRCFEQAVALDPNFAEGHHEIGAVLLHRGQLAPARASFQRVLALRPDFVPALRNLGRVSTQLGRLDDALACYERALALAPDVADIHHQLAAVLLRLGKFADADASLQRALATNPQSAAIHNDLAALCLQTDRLDDALAWCERALALDPASADARDNLATVFKQQGLLDRAIETYRAALRPERADINSNLILALHYRFGDQPEIVAPELQRWNERHAAPLASRIRPHANDRSPDRRLRIGYVSSDLLAHPVGRFLDPLLAAHDRRAVETFCYATGRRADAFTTQIRSHADHWRELAACTDDEAADAIRADRIDILVDLAQHTAGNRLPVLARKPAPVQASYLGYPGDTGLPAIDYRITDVHLDPPGAAEAAAVAQPLRLPETYWCYQPAQPGAASASPLPALKNGGITFGSLNNFCKATPPALEAWARILCAVPDSRLALHTQRGGHRLRIAEFFAGRGVAAQRLCFVDAAPLADFLRAYESIDVALDSFPFPGGTTTCDALWSGVPVVSLVGPTPLTRAGCSILANVGLPELVAPDLERYVAAAVALAADRPRLVDLRRSLRERMQNSPLTDAPRFARHIEAAYRAIWRRWCGGRGAF